MDDDGGEIEEHATDLVWMLLELFSSEQGYISPSVEGSTIEKKAGIRRRTDESALRPDALSVLGVRLAQLRIQDVLRQHEYKWEDTLKEPSADLYM